MFSKINKKNIFSLLTLFAILGLAAMVLWSGADTSVSAENSVTKKADGVDNPMAIFTGTGVGAIPDGNSGTPPQFGAPLTVNFDVSGVTFINTIALDITMTHSWVGDVEITLKSPNGTAQHSIVNRIGVTSAGTFGDDSNFGGTYNFTDGGSNIWTTATASACGGNCVVSPGSYRTTSAGSGTPTNFLAAFSSLNPSQANGTWTLTFRDAGADDTGVVTAARLMLPVGGDPTPPPTPTPTATPTVIPTPVAELDLTISQSAAPDPVRVGQPLTYTAIVKIIPSILGGNAIPQVRFDFPSGVPFQFNSASGTNGYTATPDAQGVTFTGGVLSTFGPDTATLSIVVTPQAAGTLTSAGGNVKVDPNSMVHESNENNNTAQTITTTVLPAVQTSLNLPDFDGDGKADISVFRPSNGTWYLQQSQASFAEFAFGAGEDLIAPADFDGDGKTDIAVFRPSNGTWYLQRSSLGYIGIAFGAMGDVPVPGDFDGDSKADLAVFRPSNGTWYIQGSQAGFYGFAFGDLNDKPVAADYDGDGKTDIAVFRPSKGFWYLQRSQAGFTGVLFGISEDKPVPADYDADGKADIAVFRPSNGVWYLQQSTDGFTGTAFGLGIDLPVAADYDGDGKADIAVFRPANGTWYLNRSTQGFTGIAFGASEDKPIPNAFVR